MLTSESFLGSFVELVFFGSLCQPIPKLVKKAAQVPPTARYYNTSISDDVPILINRVAYISSSDSMIIRVQNAREICISYK